jgi:NAD-dependent deacetylase
VLTGAKAGPAVRGPPRPAVRKAGRHRGPGRPTLGHMSTRKPLVALLTGAGISTDSGIPDYRGPNGVWRRDPTAEKLVTYDTYMADPEVRRRAWQVRRTSQTWAARPNAAHQAIVRLERAGVPVRVITQNVDGLHQLAGLPPRKVLELHGTARVAVCTACGARGDMAETLERVTAGEADPACLACGGILKSATVMFGQRLDPRVLAEAVAIAKACDVFLAVGSTLQVQPAASLAGLAAEHGARLTIVNADPTPYDALAADVIRAPIGEALPALLASLGQDVTATE